MLFKVSNTAHGLLPWSQESNILCGPDIDIFDFPKYAKQYFDILKTKNKEAIHTFLLKQQKYFNEIFSKKNTLFLKNVGCLVSGKTFEEAWYDGFLMVYGCTTQVLISSFVCNNYLFLFNFCYS